jgi:hypothetical protein
MSLPARLIGVLFSPGDTFRNVAAFPRWLGAMATITLVSGALWFGFLSTERGQQAMLDQQVRQLESFGQTVGDEQYDGMQRGMSAARYWVTAWVIVVGPIMTVIVAGLLFAVFNAGLGGEATFKQVLSVVTHAGMPMLLQALFTMPLNYARESTTSATNLGIFLPMLDEGSFPARFLGMIDLFITWWLIVLAIGLAVLYRRRTQPVFIGLFAVYLGIVVVIAVAMSAAAGSR